MKETESIATYHTLEEIRLRKEQLSEAIEQDNEQIGIMWNGLFKRNEDATKGEYIATMVTNAVTAIDAFLLVRKLVKNYNHLFSFFKGKKKNKKK